MSHIDYTVRHATQCHTRNLPKPNEDFTLTDETLGLFILLDGITRVHDEYHDEPGSSAACAVNHIFAQTVQAYLHRQDTATDVSRALAEAVLAGNEAVAQFRRQRSLEQWGFYPGTLGIVAMLQDDKLYYVCVGDCLGVVLRGSGKLFFGQQQTVRAVDLRQVTKAERYARYCNHPEEPLSYAIFNGDTAVAEGLEQSYIDLHHGDTVLLVTDGLGNYVRYTRTEQLKAQSPEEMLAASVVFDAPPFAGYGDDKTVIRIDCAGA